MPDYKLAADRAARKAGIDPDLFKRQIGAESNFDPKAGSPAGARGIAQMMPGTAKGLGVNLDDGKVSDDLAGAAKLMAGYIKKYGNEKDALVAYNAGPGRVGGKLPAETVAYVAKILNGADGGKGTGLLIGGKGGSPATPGTKLDSPTDLLNAAQGKNQAQYDSWRKSVGLDTETTQVFDENGFNLAKGKAAAGALIAKHNPGGILAQTLGTVAPRREDFMNTETHNVADPLAFAVELPKVDGITIGGGTTAAAGKGSGGAVAFAKSRIGHYSEVAGNNRGPELDKLQRLVGMQGAAWCAIFATTAAVHGGAGVQARTASVANINQWATNGTNGYRKGMLSTKQAKAGDLITFGNDHVGVVVSVDAKGVHTIEGNTSAGKVAERFHPHGSGKIARPLYKDK